MLISNSFDVALPVDRVWEAFDDIPGVAACAPGAELTDNPAPDQYLGRVTVRMGPVKIAMKGKANIIERDNANKTIKVEAAGADEKGRGQAAANVTSKLVPAGRGTRVDVAMDLQLAGAAAQYGRGMITDVTSVLMKEFAVNLQNRIAAIDRGEDPLRIAGAKPASGLAIGIQAMKLALARVFGRFFLPYGYQSKKA